MEQALITVNSLCFQQSEFYIISTTSWVKAKSDLILDARTVLLQRIGCTAYAVIQKFCMSLHQISGHHICLRLISAVNSGSFYFQRPGKEPGLLRENKRFSTTLIQRNQMNVKPLSQIYHSEQHHAAPFFSTVDAGVLASGQKLGLSGFTWANLI